MKNIIIHSLVAIVFSSGILSTAAARYNPNEWESIRNNKNLTVRGPEFAEAFGPEGIFNVCVLGDELKSIRPALVCTETDEIKIGLPNTESGQSTIERCKEKVYKAVSIPRTSTDEVCVRYEPATEYSSNECIESKIMTITHPTKHVLVVIPVNSEARSFKKEYTIPQCL